MKKIIKQGHKPTRVLCTECGCIFEYEVDDIESNEVYDIKSVVWNPTFFVTCPCCEHKIIV